MQVDCFVPRNDDRRYKTGVSADCFVPRNDGLVAMTAGRLDCFVPRNDDRGGNDGPCCNDGGELCCWGELGVEGLGLAEGDVDVGDLEAVVIFFFIGDVVVAGDGDW